MVGALVFMTSLITACDTSTRISAPEDDALGVVQMEIVSGGQQAAPAGTELPDPLVVRVVKASGHPKVGQVVNFVVVSGGGRVFAGTGITDSQGVAKEHWTLGGDVGTQIVEARAVDSMTGERLVFAAFQAEALALGGPVLSIRTLDFSSLGDTAQLSVGGASSVAAMRVSAAGGFSWASSDSSVASVDEFGLVRSTGNGDAVITVTQNQRADTATVQVRQLAATVNITPASASLTVGDTIVLTAHTKDRNGFLVDGAKVTWASKNNNVATLNATGTAFAVAAGQDTVVASSGPASGFAVLTVNAAPVAAEVSVTLAPGPVFTSLPDTARLGVTATDANGNPLQASQLTWRSLDTAVATVDGSGLVRSVANGNTTIVASYGTVADSAAVSVSQQVAALRVSPTTLAITVGDSGQVSASATDAKGNVVAGAAIAWSSSNAAVATVDSTGNVSANGAGAASVTATSGEASGTVQISVTALSQMSIAPSSLSFTSLQDTARLAVVGIDANGNQLSASQLSWNSASSAIATVNSQGLVQAVGNGSTIIVATYNGLADTTQVSVAQKLASVRVSPASLSMTEGDAQSLSAEATDALGSAVAGASFTWSSGNAGVATVSTSGQVSAVGAGSTTITATSGGVSGSASVSVSSGGGGLPGAMWPNEPAGYVPINEQPWDEISSNGWSHLNRGSQSRIVSDPTAPVSPGNVLEDIYPRGFTAGSEPAVDWINLNGADPIYAGFYWKPSSPWQGHGSGINKILFAYNTTHGSSLVFVMRGSPGGPYYIDVLAQGHPAQALGYLTQNVSKIPVELGEWHLIEFQSSLPGGYVRWWFDGVLVGDYSGLNLAGSGFGEFAFAPTWGGMGGSGKSQTDSYRFDHVRISIPGAGSGGGQAAVASVTVSPASTSLSQGSSATLQATPKDASGNSLTGRTTTWSSSATGVATVSGSGVVQGVAAGNATITATSGGVSGTAQVTVTASAAPITNPGTVNDLQVVNTTDGSVTLTWTQVDDGTGSPAKYALRYGSPTISWGTAGGTEVAVAGDGVGTARTYTWSGLQAGTAYQSQLVSYRGTLNVDAVWGGLSNTATGQTTASTPPPPPSNGQQLVSEGFEDGSLGSRGWFDATNVLVAADARPGSSGTRALEWRWAVGTTAPQGASRIDFTPTNSVHMSYWVKFSSNWIGSGRGYHPHLFQMLTTADDHYTGPSISHLTVYDEMLYLNGNLTAQLAIQDALMIDEGNLNVDLRGITEQRSIGGYNGQHEFDDATSTVQWDMYPYGGGQSTNYRLIRPKSIAIADAAKNGWHLVESYWQLNTVANGIGQQDGVLQYWVDGNLLVDRHDVYYRTGANPTMQFRTLLLAPYIGDGSPVDQSIWIDDLRLATSR